MATKKAKGTRRPYRNVWEEVMSDVLWLGVPQDACTGDYTAQPVLPQEYARAAEVRYCDVFHLVWPSRLDLVLSGQTLPESYYR